MRLFELLEAPMVRPTSPKAARQAPNSGRVMTYLKKIFPGAVIGTLMASTTNVTTGTVPGLKTTLKTREGENYDVKISMYAGRTVTQTNSSMITYEPLRNSVIKSGVPIMNLKNKQRITSFVVKDGADVLYFEFKTLKPLTDPRQAAAAKDAKLKADAILKDPTSDDKTKKQKIAALLNTLKAFKGGFDVGLSSDPESLVKSALGSLGNVLPGVK